VAPLCGPPGEALSQKLAQRRHQKDAPEMPEQRRQVTIVNELGLHARAASKLVQLAGKFPVEVQVGREDMMVNAKSIMGVLMLAAAKGTELHLTADGNDAVAQEALDALVALIDGRFGEER
jgi:phosphocarrier protein HPr